MIRLAHLSDLHFGAAHAHLTQRLLEHLNTLELELVVISGDLTQHAKRSEFRAAQEFLQALKHPYLVVPGNHDLSEWRLWERFVYPWKKWKAFISPELDVVYRGSGFCAVGLNTARRFGHHPDWSRGRLNVQQLSWMRRQFELSPEQDLRILVTHHPFYLTPAAQHRGHVGRHRQAWPVLQAAGVDLLLSGHLHLAYAASLNGAVMISAGTGISTRLKGEANSFHLMTASAEQLVLQTLLWNESEFAARLPQIFEKHTGTWKEKLYPELESEAATSTTLTER